MNEHEVDRVKSIQDFIFNDEVQNILSRINDNVMDFNILEITGMGNQEIKHSNILGWLFDDSEHHLEYQVLDGFLKKVIQENDNNNLQSYLYLSSNKKDITIYRESNDIDLLIVDEANKIVIAIENKVYANERKKGKDGGQLKKYENTINKQYDNEYDKYFLFLTIDSEEPSEGNEHWLTCNHQMITDTLEEILKVKEITTKTKIVLESYIDLLKRNGIVEDKKLEDLCKKIWVNKDYANAIDILIDYRTTPIQTIYNTIKNELSFQEDLNYIYLESIKKLYELIGRNFEESEEIIFEIVFNYYGGKNEHIWIGFYYPDLKDENKEFQKKCESIIGKLNTTQTNILKINKKYIGEKAVDVVVNQIIAKIDQIDKKITAIVNEISD